MAEIKIEKKKTIWPWILLGLLILAAFLYFLFFRNDDNQTETIDNTTVVTDTSNMNSNPQAGTGAVAEYMAFVNADTATMGLDHVFTHNALNKLIAATEATAAKQNFDIKADMDKAREDADKINKDPTDTHHADFIKDATSKISEALQNMQREKFPELSSTSRTVKDASAAISTADLTLDQKQTVKEFFRQAADMLQKMN